MRVPAAKAILLPHFARNFPLRRPDPARYRRFNTIRAEPAAA
jgi:hypothetical protein